MSENICEFPYGTWAPVYREMGLWPRPLQYPGVDYNSGKKLGKACKETGWQVPDHELPAGKLDEWDRKFSHHNIGLLMGSPLGDDKFLGALDIDHDRYVSLGKELLGGDPPCGRIGKKGAVFFVQVIGNLGNPEFRVKGEQNAHYGKVTECLFRKKLCVIPPSIHPDTEQPYRWIGTPLHEMDLNQLPIIGA